jgi:hypothetical protein
VKALDVFFRISALATRQQLIYTQIAIGQRDLFSVCHAGTRGHHSPGSAGTFRFLTTIRRRQWHPQAQDAFLGLFGHGTSCHCRQAARFSALGLPRSNGRLTVLGGERLATPLAHIVVGPSENI